MKRIFVLSKQDLELSRREIESLSKEGQMTGNLLIVEAPVGLEKRLALTKEILKFVFQCGEKELEKRLKSTDWNSLVKGSFALRADYDEKTLGGMMYDMLSSPKVDLDRPDTLIRIFIRKGKAICGIHESSVSTDFMERRAHLRPEMHPSSLHPRIARAAVNLTGLEKGTILDPFCGTGGILVEAALMGLDARGIDISSEMVWRCRKNLEHYGLEAELSQGDALRSELKCDAIVTDIPYGKNTSLDIPPVELVNRFLEHASSQAVSNIVLMLPSDLDVDIKGWVLVSEFTHYLHKTLSKRILVLRTP